MKRFLIILAMLFWCGNAFSKILPDASPEEQYKFAVNFIKAGDLENAEYALKEFVETHPEHELAGNAQYWYAETFRVREYYEKAANEYLNGYQQYPKSPKAPVTLLKLGVTLVWIGEWNQGCKMIRGVKSQYPKAFQSVLEKAKYEYINYQCFNSANGPQNKYAKISKDPKEVAKEEKYISVFQHYETNEQYVGVSWTVFHIAKENAYKECAKANTNSTSLCLEYSFIDKGGHGTMVWEESIKNFEYDCKRSPDSSGCSSVTKKFNLLKEEVNKLKAEIKENGVIPYERDIIADESEYALLIKEQHEFVIAEKEIILININRAKKLCIDMGFSETKSEKFSQCVLTTWKTELMGKKYAKMQKELDSQLAEIKQKQIELNDVASALNRTRNQQITRVTEVQQSSCLESLIKGALGIAAGYYLGQAIGGSTGGQTSQGNTTILRGYRCTLHPTAFDC